MFYYFGYGSNINLISLKAKGVLPVASEKAILKNWKLKFNVQHWFKHEGGMGNIEHTGNSKDVVEGMVHHCNDAELAQLDALEAYGIGYDRVEVEVETSQGLIRAFAYVGLPAFIDDACKPTRRYLNIIVKGAEAANLSPEYLVKLKNTELFEPKAYPPFKAPYKSERVFTKETLASEPTCTALLDAVFDMKEARSQLQCLHAIFGGKDMTLFHVKRHDSSSGEETLEDVLAGNISAEAAAYLNAYLNEYQNEFTYVGNYSN